MKGANTKLRVTFYDENTCIIIIDWNSDIENQLIRTLQSVYIYVCS